VLSEEIRIGGSHHYLLYTVRNLKCLLIKLTEFGVLSDVLNNLLCSFLRGGFFAFGILPLGVELIQEVTYPLDPAAPVAFVHFIALFSALLFVTCSALLEQDLPEGAPEV
jgi:hypothetical protein